MINTFIDEVVSTGPTAVLPHNLDTTWLDRIYVAAKNFLRVAAGKESDIKDSEFLGDDYSLLMLSAVTELAKHQDGDLPDSDPTDLSEDLLFEYLSCYSLSIVFESLSREGDINVVEADLETIFDRERLFTTEESNPELTEIIHTIILGDSEILNDTDE